MNHHQSTTTTSNHKTRNVRSPVSHAALIDKMIAALDGRRTSTGAQVKCPAHDDKNPSLTVTDGPTLLVHCHANCDQRAVIDALESQGLWINSDVTNCERNELIRKVGTSRNTLTPPPDEAEDPPFKSDLHWAYRSADGRVLFHVERINRADGKKDFRPWSWNGEKWIVKAWPAPRPLYGLGKLSMMPDSPILIVEGEKTCDAAQAIVGDRYACITWSNGAKAFEFSDWSALKGRSALLWPDNDEAGWSAMEEIIEILRPICPQIKYLNPNGLSYGADAADLDWDWDRLKEWATKNVEVICETPAELAQHYQNKQATTQSIPSLHTLDYDVVLPNAGEAAVDKKLETAIEQRKRESVSAGDQELLPLVTFQNVDMSKPRPQLIKGLLFLEGTSIIYGASNAGKTFFAMALAWAVATGRLFFDLKVMQGAVVYFGAEGGASVLSRVVGLKKEYPELANEPVPLAICPSAIDLATNDVDTTRVIEAIRATGNEFGQPVRFAVLDTLNSMLNGADENSNVDMGELLSSVKRIADATSAHICLIHHSGKNNSKGARGHSSLGASVDTIINIARPENDTVAVVTVPKNRDLPKTKVLHFSLKTIEVGVDEDGDAITTCIVRPEAPPAKDKRPKLKEASLQALEVLKSLNRKRGDLVALSAWRTTFYSKHCADKKPAAKTMAFDRAQEQLVEKGYVLVEGDFAREVLDGNEVHRISQK